MFETLLSNTTTDAGDSAAALSFVAETKLDIQDATKAFFRIGFRLNEAYARGFAQKLGYLSIYQLAEDEFGFKSTTTKNLMAINARFCDRYPADYTPRLAERWRGFGQTQLREMLPMSADQLSQARADMSVREIREIRLGAVGHSSDQIDKLVNLTEPSVKKADEQPTAAAQSAVLVDTMTGEVVAPTSITIEAQHGVTIAPHLTFKNNDERSAWLLAYKEHCYLWLDIPPLNAKIYRYDFRSGHALLVTVIRVDECVDRPGYYQILGSRDTKYRSEYLSRHWNFSTQTANQVTDFLRDHRDDL